MAVGMSTYEIAEAIAPSWARRREFVEQNVPAIRRWLVAELRPGPHDTVLELAAGVGDTGFEAAAVAGRLISSDFSPTMVDAARRRAAELGLTNVEHRVIDAERIDLDDDSVDGVLCRFGYMLMGDPAVAFAETRRVLRPGGRLALAVWGRPERNPFLGIAPRALGKHGHIPPPPPSGPPVFSLADPERITALLKDAGFGTVRTEEVPARFQVADADEYLSVTADTAAPIRGVLLGLSDADRATIRAEVEAALAPFAAAEGYVLPGVALCAVAS